MCLRYADPLSEGFGVRRIKGPSRRRYRLYQMFLLCGERRIIALRRQSSCPVLALTPEITELHHVRTSAEKRAAEEIANRKKCEDFDHFKSLFLQIQEEIGIRCSRDSSFRTEGRDQTRRLVYCWRPESLCRGNGRGINQSKGRTDARLRVIFDNGTESNMLMRSLQRALNNDEAGRRITDPVAGPLFSDQLAEDDQTAGTIYVLRSKSEIRTSRRNRDLIHKIGVTNMPVDNASQAQGFNRHFSWRMSRWSPPMSYTTSAARNLRT